MSKRNIHSVLQETVEEEIPAKNVDLWHQIKQKINVKPASAPKRRVALALVGTFGALIIIFFATPVYDGLAQFFLELFPKTESHVRPNYQNQTAIAKTAIAELNPTKTPEPTEIYIPAPESDVRPNYGWQIEATENPVPVKPTRTPDPSSRKDATLSIEEVEEVAGFDVLAPAIMPRADEQYGAIIPPGTNRIESLPEWEHALVPADSHLATYFYGASYDPETNIVYFFYDGYVIKQEPITGMDDCDLCTEVGSNANPITVQIGNNTGEFVIGVWELRENGIFWKNIPWVKRLRWKSNNTVFEIGYFGLPDERTMDIMVGVAESLE